MAHYSPLPQKGVSPEIRQGQTALAFLAALFEAKKRFGLRILNYVVTSNHIHLLVVDSGPDVIAKSLQLITGRAGVVSHPSEWDKSYGVIDVEFM